MTPVIRLSESSSLIWQILCRDIKAPARETLLFVRGVVATLRVAGTGIESAGIGVKATLRAALGT